MAQIYGQEHTEYLKEVLEQTRRKLLDLTRRNRLLNYRESARDIAIIDEMPDQVFRHLMNGRAFKFCHYFEGDQQSALPSSLTDQEIAGPTSKPDRTLPLSQDGREGVEARHTDDRLQTPFGERDLERRLRKLYTEHRSAIEETGANSLYLAIGFLRWHEREDSESAQHAPLVLLPVRLVKERGFGPAVYKLAFDEQALDTNYSLAEKLRHDFDIDLPALSEEDTPETYWQRTGSAIGHREAEGWGLVREMALGLFRFQKQVMWHDLNPDRWPSHASLVDKQMLRRVLLGAREGEPVPGQLSGEYDIDAGDEGVARPDLNLVRDADSSQLAALIDALEREDGLVIEGPPGTGKSQTITNLIAAALGQGLSVLFVAEKMAALEVVYKRLEEAGLGDFCLQLHGLKASKVELLQSITHRLDRSPPSAPRVSRFRQDLASARTRLLAISGILSQTVGPEDLPFYEAVWRAERLRQALPTELLPPAIAEADKVDADRLAQHSSLLSDLGREWASIPIDARDAWRGFMPHAETPQAQQAVRESIGQMRAHAEVIVAWANRTDAEGLGEPALTVTRLVSLGKSLKSALPELPAGIASELAHKVLSEGRLEEFLAFVEAVERYLALVSSVSRYMDYQALIG